MVASRGSVRVEDVDDEDEGVGALDRAVAAAGGAVALVGWDEGLVGQTVGSQILLVVPPDKGYGTSGSSDGTIKGTDTLVFVVDILNAY